MTRSTRRTGSRVRSGKLGRRPTASVESVRSRVADEGEGLTRGNGDTRVCRLRQPASGQRPGRERSRGARGRRRWRSRQLVPARTGFLAFRPRSSLPVYGPQAPNRRVCRCCQDGRWVTRQANPERETPALRRGERGVTKTLVQCRYAEPGSAAPPTAGAWPGIPLSVDIPGDPAGWRPGDLGFRPGLASGRFATLAHRWIS